ncbi:MAG: NfeD family protein [Gammaproteobacteria bacterium]|nr:NfeD family protein [Gammaproteobacteria bacterium]
MAFIEQIQFWHWLIAAVVLITLEMVVLPAVYFLWMGIAAGIVGVLMMAIPGLPFMAQIAVFTVISVVSLVVHKRYLKNNPPVTDEPTLNRRGEQYVDRVFTLEEPIVNGVGKIKVDDSIWKVMGEDMGDGGKVKVIGVDGTVFKVEAV